MKYLDNFRLGFHFSVRFVDQDSVGAFDDSLLDSLELVTAPGGNEQDKHVYHVRHHGFALVL